MPDVFISYNREDRETARLVASGLEAEGFSVWWDAALRAGETYDEVTEQNLRQAGAVVVLWSKRSSNSKWVRAEATVGERSSTLVPALIEDCDRPIRFELVQTADLRHWRGDRLDSHWREFMQDVRTAISKRSARTAPAAAAAPSVHDPSIETTFWNSIKDTQDRSDFEAYLKRYPDGHFAALAQNRIAALGRAAPPQQQRPAPQQNRPAPPRQRAAAPPPAPRAATRPPATPDRAEAKKSGNGLLIGGLIAGLAVLAGAAFMLVPRAERSPATAAIPATVEETPVVDALMARGREGYQEPVADAPDSAPDDGDAEESVEAPALDAADSAMATAAVETAPAAASAKREDVFRDCDACPLMKKIPAGAFLMGSPPGESGRNAYEGPQREVAVNAFAIGVYEVTNAEWALCAADNACRARRGDAGDLPALGVSWRDADAYATWLSRKTGRKYRLPTEAEWEYAARAGTSSAYWWGDAFDRSRVPTRSASEVGAFAPNAFGLYDVLGNAREWVADCYVNNYANAPTDGAAVSDGDCAKRVVRGGAWSSAPADMRVANRSRIDLGVTANYMGVRLAADLE